MNQKSIVVIKLKLISQLIMLVLLTNYQLMQEQLVHMFVQASYQERVLLPCSLNKMSTNTGTFIIVLILWLLRVLIHILRTLLTNFRNNNHFFSFLTMLTLRTLTTHFINIITKRSYSIDY